MRGRLRRLMNRPPDPEPDDLRLLSPLPLALRADAARLICGAFGHRIAPRAAPRLRLAQIRRGLRRDRVIAAVDKAGRLVGLTGLRGPGGGVLQLRGRRFDALRALAAPRTADLVLDCLVVAPGSRGQGIAALLVGAALARARRQGYPALRAEVERGNRAALSMFRRAGFRPQPGLPGRPKVLRRSCGTAVQSRRASIGRSWVRASASISAALALAKNVSGASPTAAAKRAAKCGSSAATAAQPSRRRYIR